MTTPLTDDDLGRLLAESVADVHAVGLLARVLARRRRRRRVVVAGVLGAAVAACVLVLVAVTLVRSPSSGGQRGPADRPTTATASTSATPRAPALFTATYLPSGYRFSSVAPAARDLPQGTTDSARTYTRAGGGTLTIRTVAGPGAPGLDQVRRDLPTAESILVRGHTGLGVAPGPGSMRRVYAWSESPTLAVRMTIDGPAALADDELQQVALGLVYGSSTAVAAVVPTVTVRPVPGFVQYGDVHEVPPGSRDVDHDLRFRPASGGADGAFVLVTIRSGHAFAPARLDELVVNNPDVALAPGLRPGREVFLLENGLPNTPALYLWHEAPGLEITVFGVGPSISLRDLQAVVAAVEVR